MKHHPKLVVCLVAVVALLFACSGVALSQEITGGIVGSVKDASGAAVKGATVTVTDPATKHVVRTVMTNDDGQFTARDLHAQIFDIAVEATGFKKHIESKVQVDVGKTLNLEIGLEVGSVSEVVTVEANPVAVELSTPTVSTIVSGDQARQLSLNNRNWVQLITLAPGVSNDLADQVYVGTTNPAGQANTMNISVNGARSAQNTYTIDGADVTDRGSNITIQAYPSVDSISEFSVKRSLFTADSGRSGGGQINVVTRGGGEKYHGSGFEFLRNEKLNANDFISNRNSNPPFGREANGKAKRTPFRYNNYGFTVGGPIYLPRFGEGGRSTTKVSRTYFFFSEEQRKDRRYPVLSGNTVPDLNMRSGVFPIDICLSATIATTTPAIGPANCTSVLPAGTALPTALVSPIAQQYLDDIYKKLPLPTDPVSRALTYPASGVADFRQEIIRIDHSFKTKGSLYYRYERDKIPTTDVNSLFSSGSSLPGVSTSATDSPGRTHTAQLTYIASPSLVVVGRWTYGYGAILSKTIGTMALSVSPITPPLPYTKTRDFVPTVSGNGFGSLATFGDYDNFSWKHNFGSDVSWTHENHSLKFGAVYSLYRKNENALGGANHGTFAGFLNTTLTSAQQAVVNAPNSVTQETNAARRTSLQQWANFLLGNNITFSQARFDLTNDLRQMAFEAYGQDEWRFRRNVTVYYGVRYSYFGSPYDKNGFLSNFDPSTFNPAAAPLVTGAGNRVVGTGNFCNGLIINSQNPK
ncbi:MAG TPA: TonB-dependent receptor, partial [Pyrinomonadaceae bacterium]|nr:TonB-dependent receptor [Pyrinomonadaceae bacterium]